MGYPMSFHRLLLRAGAVRGDWKTIIGYDEAECQPWERSGTPAAIHQHQHMLGGDAQRVIKDTLDGWHVAAYAELSGATPDEVRKLGGRSIARQPAVQRYLLSFIAFSFAEATTAGTVSGGNAFSGIQRFSLAPAQDVLSSRNSAQFL